jgi:hypothetical protein
MLREGEVASGIDIKKHHHYAEAAWEATMKKVFAVVLILAASAIGQTPKTPQAAKTPATEAPAVKDRIGRYQIFFSPHARADVYLLDTETGQIWRPITITNVRDVNLKSGAPEIWMFQDRIDNAQEFEVWNAFHQPQAAPPPQ